VSGGGESVCVGGVGVILFALISFLFSGIYIPILLLLLVLFLFLNVPIVCLHWPARSWHDIYVLEPEWCYPEELN
jgi:hypothetical protein